jgi:hypothetical protein
LKHGFEIGGNFGFDVGFEERHDGIGVGHKYVAFEMAL